jgi:hypothetical protein
MTWFAAGPKPAAQVSAFVDSVIAEAEAQSGGNYPAALPSAPEPAAHEDPTAGNPRAPSEPPSMPHIDSTPLPAGPSANAVEIAPDHAAEPFTIVDAPPLVPPDVNPANPDAEDIASVTARRARLRSRRQQKRRSSRWTAIVLVLFAFNVALIGSRAEVVRYLPQTASLFAAIGLPVNLRNLKFDNVRISKDTLESANTLIVEGTIVSIVNKAVEVPRLHFAARNASGQEIYTWTAQASRSILGPGESVDFSSRLVSPPAEASDVLVRFVNAQDAVAGAK